MNLLKRFSGERGKALLVDLLTHQRIILGNNDVAKQLAVRGRLVSLKEAEFLIEQDTWTNDIAFIVAGRVEIRIGGMKVAERGDGEHVGEMGSIDPGQPRSASVVALKPTVALVVSEEDFSTVCNQYPDLWRQLAKSLSTRLRQRSKFIRPSNTVPQIFVACSSEALAVAEAIQAFSLRNKALLEIWTDSVFKPSQGTIESLEAKLHSTDFALAIFSPDDKIESRGRTNLVPRDNTVFELGLFAGAIGRHRSFFAVESNSNVKIPSDLAGITSLRYQRHSDDNNLFDVRDVCTQIDERIDSLGPR